MNNKLKQMLTLLLVILVIFVSGCAGEDKPCAKEGEAVAYYPGGIHKDCCDGLVPKAPEGFVGGAYCLKPECNVECLYCDSESEGFYIIHPNKDTVLLEWRNCCTSEQRCTSLKGKYLDISKMEHNFTDLGVTTDEECMDMTGLCVPNIPTAIRIGSCDPPNVCLLAEHYTENICLIPISLRVTYLCSVYIAQNPDITDCPFPSASDEPVCADDGITYSSLCMACINAGKESYTLGTCGWSYTG
jgi:hypothetical protein